MPNILFECIYCGLTHRDLNVCIAHEQLEHVRVPLSDACTSTNEDEIVMDEECGNKSLNQLQHSTDEDDMHYRNDDVSFAITALEDHQEEFPSFPLHTKSSKQFIARQRPEVEALTDETFVTMYNASRTSETLQKPSKTRNSLRNKESKSTPLLDFPRRLHHEGHQYNFNERRSQRLRYRCCKHNIVRIKCRAYITTNLHGGDIRHSSALHTHEPMICKNYTQAQRKSFDPNESYGEHYGHNSALHYACLHAMKALIRTFVYDLHASPNNTNADKQTALHLVCMRSDRRALDLDDEIRCECIEILLRWNDENDPIDVEAKDVKGMTALHHASANGLRQCVERLLKADVKISAENGANETACDIAERCGFKDIAEFLEARTLFEETANKHEFRNSVPEEDTYPVVERYSGLREQDLIEAKDLLLVETSDMLQVPLFTAEALLRNHEWSRESLWAAWQKDAIGACERARVAPTASALDIVKQALATASTSSSRSGSRRHKNKLDRQRNGSTKRLADALNKHVKEGEPCCSKDLKFEKQSSTNSVTNSPMRTGDTSPTANQPQPLPQLITCFICSEEVDASIVGDEVIVNKECEHKFCRQCWKRYVTLRIQSGDAHNISCPSYDCAKLVPLDLIESVVSPTVARKYLTFDIKAFVESNPRIQWCPHPGCTNAVQLPYLEADGPPTYMRMFPNLQPPPASSRTVCCPQGHHFCWQCLQDGHEPTSCEKWTEWHKKIAATKPDELHDTKTGSETAANCLWLVTHSKPCPKCKSPIQKNEGCNHMKCSKCRQDFCWVCLGPWKKHGSETGGYFRCNRFDESRKLEERSEAMIAEAKEVSKKAQELNRFVHYYTRYKNHLNSHEMEQILRKRHEAKAEYLAKIARQKTQEDELDTKEASKKEPEEAQQLTEESNEDVTDQKSSQTTETDLSFISQAIDELLRSRRVLSSSYAYGYFLKDCGYNRTIFEYLQNELEVAIENLSALVGRQYLRGSRQRIMIATATVANRRQRFLLCIHRGLVPPETPPQLRKQKHRRAHHLPAILGLDKDDDECTALSSILSASFSRKPNAAKSSCNVPTESDSPQVTVSSSRPWVRDTRGRHHNIYALLEWPPETFVSDNEEEGEKPEVLEPMRCLMRNCKRARARNPRTGDMHTTCSLKCANLLQQQEAQDAYNMLTARRRQKYNVDRLIEMQLSKIEMVDELRRLKRRIAKGVSNPENSCDDSDEDESEEESTQRRYHVPLSPTDNDNFDAELMLAIELHTLLQVDEERDDNDSAKADSVTSEDAETKQRRQQFSTVMQSLNEKQKKRDSEFQPIVDLMKSIQDGLNF